MSKPLPIARPLELARLIREPAVSVVEVMDADLAAVERAEPDSSTRSSQWPRMLASRWCRVIAAPARRHRIGPLHGVPFTAEDIIETAGRRRRSA